MVLIVARTTMQVQDAYKESVKNLVALGFTEIEAAVYTFLVEHSPATAYRVAHGIGKPVANTYKAVESLRAKGAVLVNKTGSRLCRAVPPPQLLRKMEAQFKRHHQLAERSMAHLNTAHRDEEIYALTSKGEILSTCTALIERAEDVVLIDAFPQILDQLLEPLGAAIVRGVGVAAQIYSPIELPGARLVKEDAADAALERWRGQWLCLIVDGAEYLYAYLDEAGLRVHQALWSRSAFISWPQHSYLGDALLANELVGLVKSGASNRQLLKAIRRNEKWRALGSRGEKRLRERFQASVIGKPDLG